MDNFAKRFKIDCSPVAKEECVVVRRGTRFTVLTPCLLRVENQKNGNFCDEPTQSVWFRDFDAPKFEVKEDFGKLSALGAEPGKTFFVIWTTTTWTLPGNQAITLNPDFEYALVKANNGGTEENYIMAKELVESVMQIGGIENYETVTTFKGSMLENIICLNPLIENKTSRVILGSDAHISFDIGKLKNKKKLMEEIDFPKEHKKIEELLNYYQNTLFVTLEI